MRCQTLDGYCVNTALGSRNYCYDHDPMSFAARIETLDAALDQQIRWGERLPDHPTDRVRGVLDHIATLEADRSTALQSLYEVMEQRDTILAERDTLQRIIRERTTAEGVPEIGESLIRFAATEAAREGRVND